MKKETLTEMKKKGNEREEKIKLIRINPDAENYDIFGEIGKIKDYIVESNKQVK